MKALSLWNQTGGWFNMNIIHNNHQMKASVAYPSSNILGEGPIWHTERQSFFWVDIEGKLLNEWHPESGGKKSWTMPRRTATAVQVDDHRLVIALQGGLAGFDLNNEKLEWLTQLEEDIPTNRPNDGKCDAAGRLWLGTMDVDCSRDSGALYCIDHQLKTGKKLNGLSIANGMAWTADNKKMYFIDSPTKRVDSYLFDLEKGNIVFERTAVCVPDHMGAPDGMTIDEEGMIWVAHWDGFAVNRWNPETGALIGTVEVPVPQVSSCSFGGKNLDHLFITTARAGLSEEALIKYPLSGHVFIVETGVRGFKPYKFKID